MRLRRLLFSTGLALAATSSPVFAGDVDNANVFMVGHSLVNTTMPFMVKRLADDAGKTHQRAEQIINGAPLHWNWENSHQAQGTDGRVALPTGQWNVLVLTEAIPLQSHLTWSDTYTHAGYFHALALTANPATRTFIYETWHCIDSGTPAGCSNDAESHLPWRTRLTLDRPKWQGIADHLNTQFTGPTVELIPAGQALARLHDRAEAGAVPGLSSVYTLFSDDIHLTPAGNYFVALVMFATIYRESPEGLAHTLLDEWGTPYPGLPAADTAAAMQAMVWAVVSENLGLQAQIFVDGFEP